jgi:hypothetical protein
MEGSIGASYHLIPPGSQMFFDKARLPPSRPFIAKKSSDD